MKTTKKEIIKNMLVRELNAPDQLDLLTTEERIKLDLCASDDEKIQFAKELKKISDERYCPHLRKSGVRKLTSKAYLLLMAYNGSLSTLEKYEKYFNNKANHIVCDAHKRAASFTQLAFEAEKLYSQVSRIYQDGEESYGDFMAHRHEIR